MSQRNIYTVFSAIASGTALRAIVGKRPRSTDKVNNITHLHSLSLKPHLFDSYKTRLSRRIALSVFAGFIVIEGVVFIPSVIQKSQELENQLKEVTSAKIEWIVRTYPDASSEELLTHIQALQNKPMLKDLLGGVLYRASDGKELGRFGEQPSLSWEMVSQQQMRQRWFKFERRYDAVWFPKEMGNDYLLIIRHDALSIQQELYIYVARVVGIVLLISAFITFVTMSVVQSVVIVPILKLRDSLMAASIALQQDRINPKSYLMAVNRQDELGEVIAAFNESFLRNYEEMSRRKQAEAEAQTEREKAEKLLLNILPEPIAEELKQGRRSICDGFAEVSVLFADIVGFTTLSTLISPDELVALLNQIFSTFDDLSDRYGLEKIKTIGDNYMVAGGLPIPRPDHAEAIAQMALDMQEAIAKLDFQVEGMEPLSLRIGINTGPVIAGVIGSKKFIYDLWGDAVNTASRMESHSLPGCIQVTEATYQCLKDKYFFEKRGTLTVKGKGEMVTYWLKGRHP